MKRYIKNSKGSLTVEAVISVPIFLCFFMLLIFYVRMAFINITLNQVANETAKQLAACSYPLSFLNELEDDVFNEGINDGIPSFSEEAVKIKGYLEENRSDLIQKLLTGDLDKEDLLEAFDSIKRNVASDYVSGLAGYLVNSLGGDYYEVKTKAKYKAANILIDKFLKGSWVDRKKVEITLVMLPQSDTEYHARIEGDEDGSYAKVCSEIGVTPEQNDIVLSLRYNVKIPIPFFSSREVVYRYTAVEKAWIHGSNGVYTVNERDNGSPHSDGDDKNNAENSSPIEENYKKLQQSTVYVTKSGSRYHKSNCRYLAKSKIAIKIDDAEKKGYIPCKKCYRK